MARVIPLIFILNDMYVLLGEDDYLESDNSGWYGPDIKDDFDGIVIRLDTDDIGFFCGAQAIGEWDVTYCGKNMRLTREERVNIYREVRRALHAHFRDTKKGDGFSLVFGDRERQGTSLTLWEFGCTCANYATPIYTNPNSGNRVMLFVINA